MGIFQPFKYIHPVEIETKAWQILEKMEQTPNYAPKFPLDASRVAEFLGLDVVWDSIPADEQGIVAARILPLERLIEINEDIPQLRGGFGESTIAHEIGHWVLHINQEAVARLSRLHKKGLKIPVEPLLCRNNEDLVGIEWQAQYFASCLLMPQYHLLSVTKNKDITQWQHLYQIAEQLGITISNLTYRLQNLGWIHISKRSRQITLSKSAPALSRERESPLLR